MKATTITKIFCIICALPLMGNSLIFAQTTDADVELGLRIGPRRVSSVYLKRGHHTLERVTSPVKHSAAEMLRRNPIPFSVLFKYDTTWNNPAHRCYEIIKPITPTVLLRFNFISLSQYTVGSNR